MIIIRRAGKMVGVGRIVMKAAAMAMTDADTEMTDIAMATMAGMMADASHAKAIGSKSIIRVLMKMARSLNRRMTAVPLRPFSSVAAMS